MVTFVLTSVASSSGVYTGTITAGATTDFSGQVFTFSGFLKAANNGTFLVTANDGTTLTTTNSNSVSETHAATATDVTVALALDAGGFPQKVVNACAATGAAASSEFTLLDRPGGGPRTLWLQLGATTGTFSAIKVDLLQSFDGGASWQTLQSGIDLYNSPAQAVSPSPSTGATLKLTCSTFTGGTTFDVIASQN